MYIHVHVHSIQCIKNLSTLFNHGVLFVFALYPGCVRNDDPTYNYSLKVNFYFVLHRLLGTATVPLRDLLQSKSHSLNSTLKLLDGNKRPTTVNHVICYPRHYINILLYHKCETTYNCLFFSLFYISVCMIIKPSIQNISYWPYVSTLHVHVTVCSRFFLKGKMDNIHTDRSFEKEPARFEMYM